MKTHEVLTTAGHMAPRGTVRDLLALSHRRTALLSVAQPGLAAVLAAGGLPNPRTLALGLMAATAGTLCLYAVHDLLDSGVDREIERRGPGTGRTGAAPRDRPLAQGSLTTGSALVWIVMLAAAALGTAYALRPACALIFLLCAAVEALYCSLRRTTWLKTLPAGAVVGLGGLAGWTAVRDPDRGAFLVVLLLAAWEIFGRNLANDLADLSLDRPLGIRTLATTHGPVWSARACAAGSLAMVPLALAQPGELPLRALLAAVVVGTMTLPAIGLLRRPQESVAQAYYDRASLFPPAALGAAAFFFIAWGGA